MGGAAYRAGENIKARGQGEDGADKWFRYANRSVVVREAFIMAPDDAPEFVSDRSELWNRVEEMETHKKARLGREVQLGRAYAHGMHIICSLFNLSDLNASNVVVSCLIIIRHSSI